MTKKETVKYNDACVKLFEFLIKLYQEDADYKWVLEHFSDGNYDGTSNTHVTLNKYLNALKIFGIKIKKSNNKYQLLSPLYKIKLEQNDIKSIQILKAACKLLPNGKNKTNCNKFIKDLEIRFDETTQNLSKIVDSTQNLNFTFYNSEMVEQVKLCEKYCQEKQKLEIIYVNEKNEEFNLLGSPIETVYEKRKICLNILGNNGNRIYQIPIDNIKSIKQLPSFANRNSIPTTVVYKIKNKLAKNYKTRDNETLQSIESDGCHIIINKNEDFNLLLNRLMRYGRECEIISPKFLREEMIELINKTLSNYQ